VVIIQKYRDRIVLSIQSCLPPESKIRPIALNNIVFYQEDEDDPMPCGSSELTQDRINIYLGDSMSKTSKILLEGVLAHEITHFLTKTVVLDKKIEEPTSGLATFNVKQGFTRIYTDRYFYYGFFAEPLAELFILYHLKKDVSLFSPFSKKIRFLVTMIEVMAARQEKDPVSIFKNFLSAQILQDYNFQAELVKTFGTNFVRTCNKTKVKIGPLLGDYIPESESVFLELAKLGNFEAEWNKMISPNKVEENISLSGLKGGFLQN